MLASYGDFVAQILEDQNHHQIILTIGVQQLNILAVTLRREWTLSHWTGHLHKTPLSRPTHHLYLPDPNTNFTILRRDNDGAG